MGNEKQGQPRENWPALCIEKIKKLKIGLTSKRNIIILICIFSVVTIVASIFFSKNKNIYAVRIDGYQMEVVKSKKTVKLIANKLLQLESGMYNLDLIFNQDIVYERIKRR